MNIKQRILLSSILATVTATAQAGMIVDGDLKDWINQPSGNSSDWLPTDSSVKYAIEDQSGLDNGGYLSPGYGGQAYDAEAIYLKRDANFFYVAVVTGLSPDIKEFPAGDLAFDFGNDGSYEYGVVVKSDSRNTDVNSSQNGGIGRQGEVYKVDKWNVGLWADNGAYVGTGLGTQAHPTTVNSGTKLGNAELVYTEALYNSQLILGQLGNYKGSHYVIEAKIPTLVFAAADLAKAFTVHWTMACANDSIEVDPPAKAVAAPATLSLLMLGFAALTSRRGKGFSQGLAV